MYRSMLFVPAANAKAMTKAPSLGADAIIIDLEDGLAPEQKDEGRTATIRFLRENRNMQTPVLVRVNNDKEGVLGADIRAISLEQPSAVLVPKVENTEVLHKIKGQIKSILHGSGKVVPALWAMIETPLGLANLHNITSNSRLFGLQGLVLGTNDLVLALGCAVKPDREPLLSHLAQIVLQARAHGLVAIDGVYNNFSDPEGFAKEAEQGKAFGFDGKSLIHPSQIEPANLVFSPSEEQIKQAKAIVRSYSYKKNADKGAINVGGQMVERLHLQAAKELLAKMDKGKGSK